jgi:hypothetical protein
MKSIELESWALRVLERVEKHVPIEDSRVEIKGEWPDASKTVRRLAGHANAARGENILWLIGADETKGVVGANHHELSNWLSQVKAGFESEVPALQDLNITFKDKTVAALVFDTSRFPYVIKNPSFGTKGGEFELEVPWREGTAVRSAKRSDLVLMLSPLAKMPKVEILGGAIRFVTVQPGNSGSYLGFTLNLYMVALDNSGITFPFHKCEAVIMAAGRAVANAFCVKMNTQRNTDEEAKKYSLLGRRVDTFSPSDARVDVRAFAEAIEATSDEIVIRGSGKIMVEGSVVVPALQDWPELELRVTLRDAITESRLALIGKFVRHEQSNKNDPMLWTLFERCMETSRSD